MLFDQMPKNSGSTDEGAVSGVSGQPGAAESEGIDRKPGELLLAGPRCSRLLRGALAALECLTPWLRMDADRAIADFVGGGDIAPAPHHAKTGQSLYGEQVVTIRNTSIYYYERRGEHVIYEVGCDGPDDGPGGGSLPPPRLALDLEAIGAMQASLAHADYGIAAIQDCLANLGRHFVLAILAALLGNQLSLVAISRLASLVSNAFTRSCRTSGWSIDGNLGDNAVREFALASSLSRTLHATPVVLACRYLGDVSHLLNDELPASSLNEISGDRAEEIRAELRMECSHNGLWIFVLDLLYRNSCHSLGASLKLAAIDDLPSPPTWTDSAVGRVVVHLRRKS